MTQRIQGVANVLLQLGGAAVAENLTLYRFCSSPVEVTLGSNCCVIAASMRIASPCIILRHKDSGSMHRVKAANKV